MEILKFTNIFLTASIFSFTGCSGKEDQKPQSKTEQTQPNVKKDSASNLETSSIKTDSIKNETANLSNIVILETSLGDIKIELFEKDAPKHVENFKKLVNSKFYNSTTFHRVIQGFMIQGGDPNSKDNDKSNDGLGGPGYTIPAEINLKHSKGSLAAARLGDQVNPKRESSGSQFYIVTGEASHLDGQYTVFGKVIDGMDIVLKIEKVKTDVRDNPVEKVEIEKVYFAE